MGTESEGEDLVRDWDSKPVPLHGRREMVAIFTQGYTTRPQRSYMPAVLIKAKTVGPDSSFKKVFDQSACYTACAYAQSYTYHVLHSFSFKTSI